MAKTYTYKCLTCGMVGYGDNPRQKYCYGCSYIKNAPGHGIKV
jgi:hypothetical protein